MGCEAQLAAQLYKHFLWWPVHPMHGQSVRPSFCFMIRVHQWVCACRITSVYVKRLWVVPPWLTHRQTDSFRPVILLAWLSSWAKNWPRIGPTVILYHFWDVKLHF